MERRTTVRLEEGLLLDAKRLALDTGRTLTAVIADALREAVARGRRPAPEADARTRTLSAGLETDRGPAARRELE